MEGYTIPWAVKGAYNHFRTPSNVPSPPTSACQSHNAAPLRSIQWHESQRPPGYSHDSFMYSGFVWRRDRDSWEMEACMAIWASTLQAMDGEKNTKQAGLCVFVCQSVTHTHGSHTPSRPSNYSVIMVGAEILFFVAVASFLSILPPSALLDLVQTELLVPWLIHTL